MAALQFFKRCPVNLRPLFGVRPGVNPKAHGLLVAAYVMKYRRTGAQEDLNRAKEFAHWLINNCSTGCSGAAWGYNFDWPNRNAVFPAGTPTIVNTAYIAEALLDLYEVTEETRYRDVAVSSARFLLNDLNRERSEDEFCFSYTPLDRTQIHNANMLGAALLARLHSLTGDAGFREPAAASMRFSARRQQQDGSWLYGTEARNGWIDSYHTGYNLLALHRYQEAMRTDVYEGALRKGFEFYLDHFFTPEGYVKYFHDRIYPWDGHAMAHAVLTLTELAALAPERSDDMRGRVLSRIRDTFWNPRREYFIYQVHRRYTNTIDYYRWVQCWMFYALVKVEGWKG
ncbi:MAG: hypothetical protein KBA51_05775 [Kiritimatiellae bacterium]|nr:hypothetical protein [Kiritimatiellia bacterium]